MRTALLFTLALVISANALAQNSPQAFDQTHGAWNSLLAKHVIVVDSGHASRVRYRELAKERQLLKQYLASLSQVGPSEFQDWPKAQRLAFLLNAYNAYTVEKILTRYPDLRSIWDFGRIFGNPFKDRFFTLLGRPTSLDDIENEMLRKAGAYDDVRIHFALNCASVGCPMLRPEAYAPDRLGAQLEDQLRRFLSDHSRNRFDPGTGSLKISKIFDWAKEDWLRGTRNFDGGAPPVSSREAFLARYAKLLADEPTGAAQVAAQRAPLEFLDYDWSINDAEPAS